MDNPETQATMSTQDTGPLEAARIATGLPIFTKTEILYRETGWELYLRDGREGNFNFFII